MELFSLVLHRACERSQIPLAIGRDGSDLRAPTGYGAASTGESEWFSFDVFGRHLVDLLTLAEAEINTKRIEQSFTLTSLAKHFDIPIGTEKAIPLQQIVEEWHHQPENIINQSLCNVRIARDLYNHLSPPLFYLAQMCPFTYRMLTQLSAASRIESLMLREYVRQRYSVPRAIENSRSMTFPPEIYHTGVFPEVMYVELAGICPSILLRQNIKPKTDELNIFPLLLTRLSDLQRNIHNQMTGERTPSKDAAYKLKALKRLIDSFHLYLGSARGFVQRSRTSRNCHDSQP